MSQQALTRDLTLLRGPESDLLRQALTKPWRQWAEAWGLDLPADAALLVSPTGPESADMANAEWQTWPSAPANLAAWSHLPPGGRAKVAAELIGRPATAPLPQGDFALAAADRALADLLLRYRQALPAGPKQSDSAARNHLTADQAWLPYSGALLVTEPHSGLICLLGREAYAALLPSHAGATAKAAAPSGLLQALAQQRLPVTLGLGEVEIPMADLLELQTGDVIQFPIRLSDELPLTLAADVAPSPALICHLGQLDGRLAIKLVSKAKAA